MILRISIVNHPDLTNPEHFKAPDSIRLSRAIKQARRERVSLNGNTMLWGSKDQGKTWFRISLAVKRTAPMHHASRKAGAA